MLLVSTQVSVQARCPGRSGGLQNAESGSWTEVSVLVPGSTLICAVATATKCNETTSLPIACEKDLAALSPTGLVGSILLDRGVAAFNTDGTLRLLQSLLVLLQDTLLVLRQLTSMRTIVRASL